MVIKGCLDAYLAAITYNKRKILREQKRREDTSCIEE